MKTTAFTSIIILTLSGCSAKNGTPADNIESLILLEEQEDLESSEAPQASTQNNPDAGEGAKAKMDEGQQVTAMAFGGVQIEEELITAADSVPTPASSDLNNDAIIGLIGKRSPS